MATEIIETCPLCQAPTKDGRLTCECDAPCGGCPETKGARAGGMNPHIFCDCQCHYTFARAMAEREAGGPLCGECGSKLYDGDCLNEGGCSRYCAHDYDDRPIVCYFSVCDNDAVGGGDYCSDHDTCENRDHECCDQMTDAQHHRELGTWPYGQRPSEMTEPLMKLLDFRTEWLRPRIDEAMADLGMPTEGVTIIDLDDVPF